MDVREFTRKQFQTTLAAQNADLNKELLGKVEEAFAFDQVQTVVDKNLSSAKDTRKREKTHRRELGRLSRGFANCIALEIRNGSSGASAIKIAFARWRSSRSFGEIAKRYHLQGMGTTTIANCRESLEAA